ncbi:MAG TPA: NAD(P)/FAD-dependent oxidoreductase, partial [Kribbellaceae bacterium]
METVDVLVVGGGLAGLHTARLLASRGLEVLAVERRASLDTGIRTTGIFVRRTLDDFDVPRRLLGPGIRDVVLYPPSRRSPVRLRSDRDEFRVADMGRVYAHAMAAARRVGARVRLGVRYVGRDPDGLVHLARGSRMSTVATRFVVGADGAHSRVARDLGLDVNRRILVGAELVYPVSPSAGAAPAFHCVIDPRLAPGYLAWVVNDGRHAHVGLAGYPDRMRRGLRALLEDFAASAPILPTPAVQAPAIPAPTGPVQRRGGPIPVGGVLRRIVCREGLLVGDAAGAVSPLTAGGLDPCLRMSELAADVIDRYLRSGDPSALWGYDGGAMRARFRGRLLMRRAIGAVRSPAAAEAAVALLRTAPGRAAAARILFGDGSFPETSVIVAGGRPLSAAEP